MRTAAVADAPFLRLDGLSRRLGGRVALEPLTLDIQRGEIFGLLGPNGAGKSTTFRLLLGLLAPDAGRILFDGVEVDPASAAFRSRLGVVFQHPSVDTVLTGRENLRLGATLYGLPRAVAQSRIARALDQAELTSRADEAVSRYSGGMRRRLELGRVLLHDPELLVLDEPGAGLDQASLRRFWQTLAALRDERRLTIVVTTHQPEEAEWCDRLAILDAGRLVAVGSPEELRRRVGGDVVTLEADDAEALAADVNARFGAAATLVEGRVTFEHPRAIEIIPRLVESLPAGRLRSVSMRRPTLADVFIKITGHTLAEETHAASDA